MAEWQPIETAPQDGTPVIAYQPEGTFSNGLVFPESVGLAYWCKKDSLNPAHWSGPAHPRGWPTHWMPLPEPPEDAAKLTAV